MTDKMDSRQIEFWPAGMVRVSVVLKPNPRFAKSSSVSKGIASHEGGTADGCRWEIGKQQDPGFDPRS